MAVVTVAHRLATALEADRVVVPDKGRIVEEGTPAALVAMKGRFAALLELEAAGWDWRKQSVSRDARGQAQELLPARRRRPDCDREGRTAAVIARVVPVTAAEADRVIDGLRYADFTATPPSWPSILAAHTHSRAVLAHLQAPEPLASSTRRCTSPVPEGSGSSQVGHGVRAASSASCG